MADETPQAAPGAATTDPRLLNTHPRDLHMDAAGWELWELIQAWRKKWEPTRVEYLWVLQQAQNNELRAYGKEERDRLDAK